MKEWISVNDGMPKKRTHVLVWFADTEPKVAYFATRHFFEHPLCDNTITKFVTHWLELPPPPKGVL